MKSAGLETLVRELTQLTDVVEGLDADIAALKVESDDPASVQGAILRMEQTIDRKLAVYRHSPLAEPLIEVLKSKYRKRILNLAATGDEAP
jgi:hypothetical protein